MIDPVTTRYAEALFALAKRRGVVEAVRRDVKRIARELETRGAATLFDARRPVEERRAQARELCAGAHEFVRNFVLLVFDKRREEVLRGLARALERRVLQDLGVAEGTVESARPLPGPELESLARAVGTRLGKTVRLENRVRPELLGGVRVLVEGKLIDATLRGRLDELEKRLLATPLSGLARA
jgi:F-type H+-transporting ATPase subunit delta